MMSDSIEPDSFAGYDPAKAKRNDSAWGRASFTEAEIKKAFEVVADQEDSLEAKTSAGTAKSPKSKRDKKEDKQRRKKEEKEQKKKDKKDKDKKPAKVEDVDEWQDELRQEGEWQELIKTSGDFPDIDLVSLSELTEEQLKVDTFEEWTKIADAATNIPSDASAHFDPFQRIVRLLSERYRFLGLMHMVLNDQVVAAKKLFPWEACIYFGFWQSPTNAQKNEISFRLLPLFARLTYLARQNTLDEGSINTNVKPLTDLVSSVTIQIFQMLGFRDLDTVGRVCKQWKELVMTNLFLWRDLYRAYDSRIVGGEQDKHLWDELGTDFSTAPDVTPGGVREASLNALVAAVTPQAGLPDMMDINTFLTTYQTFTTTPQLIKKLLQRYQVPEKSFEKVEEQKQFTVNVVRPIQLRVSKLLKLIIDTNYREILMEEDLLNVIRSFVRGFVDQPALSKQIQTSLLATGKKLWDELQATSSPQALGKTVGTIKDIYDLSTEEIARQLTLLEFEIYKQIKPAEFFGQAWAKEKTHHRAPHIRMLIDRFNLITRWITTEIVNEDRIRSRVRRYVKFIKVAQELRTMNNFHTLMAVLGGLNEGPIYRLKHTIAEIPQKLKDTLKSLQDLMSADGSYSAYRTELASATPPCIPYIGIYLRDLTYFEEGGSSEDGLINFKKKKNVYSVIQIIQKYQAESYTARKNERAYNYLKDPPRMADAELFRLSLAIEPRNAKRSEIQ